MNDTSATAQPFTGVDRRALRSVAVQFFVNGAAFASFVPRLPEIRERIDVGLDGLGLLLSLAITVGTIGSLRSPALIARFGTRTTLILGGILMLSGLPLIGFATSPAVFLVGASIMFVADGLVDVSMNLQGSWLSARRHAPVMNRLHGLWSLGTVTGGLVAAQLAARGVSLETHLTVVAMLMVAALFFVGRGLLTEDERGVEPTDGPQAGEPDDVDGVPNPAPQAQMRQGRRGLVLIAIAGACAITIELVSSDWAAFRLAEDFGAAAGLAGLGYVAYTTGMTVGRFSGDWAVMRVGSDRLLRASLVVTAVGLTVAAFGTTEWVVLAAYVVTGLGTSTMFPKLYDDAARYAGRRGAGLAWLRTGSSLTALFIPSLVGVLAATSLSVGAATAIVTLPCLAVLAGLSALSAPGSRRSRRR